MWDTEYRSIRGGNPEKSSLRCKISLLSNVDTLPNKFISSYTVFRTFDTSLGLKHLADPAYSEFITLFAQWSNVFSYNKYDVSLIKEEYFIRLSDGTPVKSYTPCHSPAVVEAIESELEKLERAGFIEPLNSPYLAPTVCVK